MAYDENGRYYFNPNDEEDMADLFNRQALKDKEAALDAIVDAQKYNNQLIERDNVIIKQVMEEHGITQEESLQYLRENPQVVVETRAAVIRNLGKKIAAEKKGAPAGQPGAQPRGGQPKPVNRELGALKERANKGGVITEDDELSALGIVLGDDFKI